MDANSKRQQSFNANWIHIIKEHMQKSIRLSDYHYPYAVLISKFLHYFEVDLEEQQSKFVKTSNEISNDSLSKLVEDG